MGEAPRTDFYALLQVALPLLSFMVAFAMALLEHEPWSTTLVAGPNGVFARLLGLGVRTSRSTLENRIGSPSSFRPRRGA